MSNNQSQGASIEAVTCKRCKGARYTLPLGVEYTEPCAACKGTGRRRTPAAAGGAGELPPLPKPFCKVGAGNPGLWAERGADGGEPVFTAQQFREGQRAAIAADRAQRQAPAVREVPAGWQLVPVELTDEMIVAFAETWFSKVRPIDDCCMEDCYAAMLAASPATVTAPAQPEQWKPLGKFAEVIAAPAAQPADDLQSAYHADYHYLLGLRAGWNLSQQRDVQGFNAALASRQISLDAAKDELRAAPAAQQAAPLSNEQIFEIAALYFVWNADSWKKATEGRIGMPALLEFTKAAIKRAAPTTAGMVEDAKDAAPEQRSREWQPVTGPGQVRKGDKLRFKIGDKTYNERAKLILHSGTNKEEVIYDKGRNFYFITSMVMSGKSNHKCVEFLAAQQAQASAKDEGLDPNQVQTVADRIRNTRGLLVAKESGAMGDDLKGSA